MSQESTKCNEEDEFPSIMVTPDSPPTQDDHVEKYIVEEEIIVGIPLVRPSEPFLDVLRLAGAKVEVFTKKEICQYLKDYIGARKLYDATDPRIVYCENDPLEKVFCVKKFTINDVLDLIQKNVSSVPDTCIKRMRQMVCRTMTVTSPTNKSSHTSNQIPVIPSSQTSFTIASCRTTPIITSTTSTLLSSHRKSSKHQSDGSRSSNRKRRHDASSDPTDNCSVRKRRTSLSVTYSDSETASYPWYFHVKMGTSEDSEKHSVQEHQTRIVEDTSDDLWFVEEDTISVQYDSDAFSIEYDVESGTSDLSDSDCSSITSGKDIFVMCNDSDVEFWADSSAADIESDPEIPDCDKWTCEECKERNTPRQAYCCKCWKMRPGWFAVKQKKKSSVKTKRTFTRSLSAPGGISSSDSSDSVYHRPGLIKHTPSSSLLSSSDNSPPMCNKSISQPIIDGGLHLSKDDSGISLASCSTHQSSQEKTCFSQDSISLSPVIRNSLSNFQIVETPVIDTESLEEKVEISNESSQYVSSAIFISDTGSASTFVEPQEPARNSKTISKQKDEKLQAKSINKDTDLCIVCLSKPKTGSIIHGSSGHQVCCFKCAKQLKRRKKVCPVCRRPIQKVVRNYLL